MLLPFSALFLGVALMMLGAGLQGSLLGVRGVIEGFDTGVLGVVMSGYFAGFLAGSAIVPRFVGRVGHIRVFAALASLASATVLAHAAFPEPWLWGLMRLLTGFSYAGLYIVVESWLNDMSDNRSRGKVLGTYMVIQLGALSLSQVLLMLGDPASAGPFMLIAVLVSLAVMPVCLSASRTPDFSAPEAMSILALYRLSPLGTVGMALTGMSNGAVFGFSAVYARQAGFSIPEISAFVALVFGIGMLLQWPVGRLSDRFDRRSVIAVVTFVTAGIALLAAILPGTGATIPVLIAVGAIAGGLSVPLYSLFNTHVNDMVEPRQRIAASGRLIFLNGIGAIAGPNIAAQLMDATGPGGYFTTLVILHVAIGLMTIWRMLQRPAPPGGETVDFVAMPVRGTAMTAQLVPEPADQPDDGRKDEQA
ncbi:MAG: MFS transporter [Pseudomonadota bacterium]|nr:MFS transporter [Pseudomonadota bacterium]